MLNSLLLFLIFVAPNLLYGQLFPNLGGQRVGTSAAQFLKIGVGARSISMGNTGVAMPGSGYAFYYNPALAGNLFQR